jgi:hypothetical protein
MTFTEYAAGRDAIEEAIRTVGDRLKAYPRGPMGLTLDGAKDAAWYADMRLLSSFRAQSMRHSRGNLTRFKKELRAEAKARRIAKGWVNE